MKQTSNFYQNKEGNMEYEELEPLIIEDEDGELIANPEYEN